MRRAVRIRNPDRLTRPPLSLDYALHLRDFVHQHLCSPVVDCVHDKDQHVLAKSRRKRDRIPDRDHRGADIRERGISGAQTLPHQYLKYVRDDDVEVPLPAILAPHRCIIDVTDGLVELMKR
jgi:hypothetical protein